MSEEKNFTINLPGGQDISDKSFGNTNLEDVPDGRGGVSRPTVFRSNNGPDIYLVLNAQHCEVNLGGANANNSQNTNISQHRGASSFQNNTPVPLSQWMEKRPSAQIHDEYQHQRSLHPFEEAGLQSLVCNSCGGIYRDISCPNRPFIKYCQCNMSFVSEEDNNMLNRQFVEMVGDSVPNSNQGKEIETVKKGIVTFDSFLHQIKKSKPENNCFTSDANESVELATDTYEADPSLNPNEFKIDDAQDKLKITEPKQDESKYPSENNVTQSSISPAAELDDCTLITSPNVSSPKVPSNLDDLTLDDAFRDTLRTSREIIFSVVNEVECSTDGRFTCPFCDQSYSTVSSLRLHCATACSDCNFADTLLPLSDELIFNSKAIQCPWCGAIHTKPSTLRGHCAISCPVIHSSQSNCTKCNQIFSNPDDLKSHWDNFHKVFINTEKTATANKKIKISDKLFMKQNINNEDELEKVTTNSVHEEEQKQCRESNCNDGSQLIPSEKQSTLQEWNFRCTKCNQPYDSILSLYDHVQSSCSNTFKTNFDPKELHMQEEQIMKDSSDDEVLDSLLDRMEKIHSSDDSTENSNTDLANVITVDDKSSENGVSLPKPSGNQGIFNICNVCGTSFLTPSTLLRHMKLHRNAPQYLNELAFSREKAMDRNRGRTYRNLQIKKKFQNLVKTAKGEKNISAKKLYQFFSEVGYGSSTACFCFVCGKYMFSQIYLKIHMRTHVKRKLLKCKHCEVNFTYKKEFNLHKCTKFIKKFTTNTMTKIVEPVSNSSTTNMKVQMSNNSSAPELVSRVIEKNYANNSSSLDKHLQNCPEDISTAQESLAISNVPVYINTYSDKSILKRNESVQKAKVIDISSKLIKCNDCEKSFSSQAKVNFHQRFCKNRTSHINEEEKHESEKSTGNDVTSAVNNQSYCSYNSSSSDDDIALVNFVKIKPLKRKSPRILQISHDSNADDMPYYCNYCDKGYSDILNLTNHISEFCFMNPNLQLAELDTEPSSPAEPQTNTAEITPSSPQPQTNTAEIVTSTSRLQTNTTEIVTSTPRPQTNTAQIVTSTSRSQTNTAEIVTSTPRPQTNTAEIVTSTSWPQTNTAEIVTSPPRPQTITADIATPSSSMVADMEETRFECGVCERGYNMPWRLKTHLEMHVEKSINCRKCMKTFTTYISFHDHLQKANRVFVCGGNTRGSEESQKSNEEVEDLSTTNPFICNVCNNKFRSIPDLVKHIQLHITQDV